MVVWMKCKLLPQHLRRYRSLSNIIDLNSNPLFVHMRKIFLFVFLSSAFFTVYAQGISPAPRALSMADYDKAKTLRVKDLDNETYAKFDNTYILDRYEMRKPFFITGDDGLKKRIDLYKLLLKDQMQEVGTVIFYTNEAGKLYSAVQPNFTADGKVWEKYFEDIHAIDKIERNFVLKLSYVLSREMSFQLYKAMNAGKVVKEEAGTYGTDICFPGHLEVAMANGFKKRLSSIQEGDLVISVDPVTGRPEPAEVVKLVQHEARNYAISTLLLMNADDIISDYGIEVKLSVKVIEATPNHPMQTLSGKKTIGSMEPGDEIVCFDSVSKTYRTYSLVDLIEKPAGLQKVYNLIVKKGGAFLMNDVIVLQK